MKYAASTALLLLLVFAGAAAYAAACPSTCPQPVRQVQCPQPCPKPAQVQCPPPCPAPCPPVCPAVPASVGAGPNLAGLECPDFDPAYMREVHQHNATIIAVTEYGGQRTRNGNLRDISSEIRNRLVGANRKLEAFYAGCGCLSADPARAQAIIDQLCKESDECFDVAYAKTLSGLIKQSQAADELASNKAVNPRMKQQAQFMVDKESDWAFRLDRWVTDHGYTA